MKSNTELSYGTPQLDLFEDLRSKDTSEIKKELQELYSALNVVEKSVSVRESERNDAIRMSKALRKNAELAKGTSNIIIRTKTEKVKN